MYRRRCSDGRNEGAVRSIYSVTGTRFSTEEGALVQLVMRWSNACACIRSSKKNKRTMHKFLLYARHANHAHGKSNRNNTYAPDFTCKNNEIWGSWLARTEERSWYVLLASIIFFFFVLYSASIILIGPIGKWLLIIAILCPHYFPVPGMEDSKEELINTCQSHFSF